VPELPEVEVVRRGLDRWVVGRRVAAVDVLHERPVRRHLAGPADLVARLRDGRVTAAVRRGKYLWLELAHDDQDAGSGPVPAGSPVVSPVVSPVASPPGEALLAHLGMSGQLVLQPAEAPPERHLRAVLDFADDGPQLRFVDQRMFGGLAVVDLVPTPDGGPGGLAGPAEDPVPSGPWLPAGVGHIARDPLDPHLDEAALVERVRRRRTGVKRALLDQTLLSGVGNIYADEALWRSRLHFARPTDTLTRPAVRRLLADLRDVMAAALAEGGTSFDSLYVDVNGQSGYFDRSLDVYGRSGLPCRRCGTPVRRDAFMNRSSFTCPRCQPRPRRARW
jgi:formamidopyrimidine-DNA glycosylase